MKKRPAAIAATMVLVAVSLAGCGGGSAYCDAVKGDQKSLNSFGKTRTNDAYASYVTTFQGIAKVAPKSVAKDWKALAEATQAVLDAQKKAKIALEDMTDTNKVAKVGQGELADLNKAYEAFNGTTDQRTAVVENVSQECDITLS